MAEIKAGEADAFVSRPHETFRTFLLYGPDSGLVSERADVLSATFGIDRNDPFAFIRLDADTAAGDKARISDEAHTVGMFGDSRLIRISGVTRKNLADAIQPVLDFPPAQSWIIIEAGDLKKDSALRKNVEKSTSGVAIPCYADNAGALNRLITSVLQQYGLTIGHEAQDLLRSSLGADRRASRNELEKLALYCEGQTSISPDDVRAIIGDVAAFETDDMIDSAATGNINRLEELLPRLATSGTTPDMLLLSCLRHFQNLHQGRFMMEHARKPAQAVVSSMRPPLHFSRRDSFTRALSIWNLAMISRALGRLDRAALEARANPVLANSLAGTALLALGLEARRGSRN
ncbi:MAG: DNA polymerase III subunit delta [Rhizobiaceae bacterium]